MKHEAATETPDAYFKKAIPYTHRGEAFTFQVGHTLFSSFDVDDGTDLLLRTMDPGNPQRILDIGCGIGTIGIVLARQFPQTETLLIDRDLLAVRYANYNAQINQTPNVRTLGSIGCEQVPAGTFDLIVSNIPAKIGDVAITNEFILEPLRRLSPQGVYWFVVVSGLNHLIPRIGAQHQLHLKEIKKRSGYSVYCLRP